jgi:phosphatidylserine decarboxylase
MSIPQAIRALLQQEDLNFLLTNRLPRATLTRLMGWFSRIERPWLAALSIKAWQFFSPLDLSEAQKSHFKSVQECFTRALKPGARPIDAAPGVLVSPCDALLGAHGQVRHGELFQAKGFAYRLEELIPDAELARSYEGCDYATLRLTASMYHRFHAPADAQVRKVTYIAGDTWNVNPIALRRVAKLFCKNERAVIECALEAAGPAHPILTLVPVAAILVASIRLHCIDALLHVDYRGPRVWPCAAPVRRGEELGWFEHGSTILVFAPAGYRLLAGWQLGSRVNMGQGLFATTACETPSDR